MVPPAMGSSDRDDNSTITKIQYTTSESNNMDRGRGWSQGGSVVRGGYQGCCGWSGRFYQMSHTSSIRKFEGELEYFGAILWTRDEQREAKYQFKKFRNNMIQ